jgi:hypothetical protein
MLGRSSKALLPSEGAPHDGGTTVIKGARAAIPIAGGAAAELSGLLNLPLARRRDAWFQDLADRLRELESQIEGFSLDNLAANESFISAMLQAAQAALRTHQKEKLEALRDAVLNTAAGQASDGDYHTVFLALIDRFSAGHLRVLKSFRHPVVLRQTIDYLGWQLCGLDQSNQSWREWPRWVRDFTPGFEDASQEFIHGLLSDLYSAGLIRAEADSFDQLPSEPWTTKFGGIFLRFIEAPKVDE